MRKQDGFTLIELLIVIAIIAILASVMAPTMQDFMARARNAGRMANLDTLHVALEVFQRDNGSYPSTGGAWWGVVGSGYGSHSHCDANGYVPGLCPTYIARLPADPMAGKFNPAVGATNNGFLYRSDGVEFKLLSHYGPEAPNHRYGDESFKFYDPSRPTWAWQKSSPGGRNW